MLYAPYALDNPDTYQTNESNQTSYNSFVDLNNELYNYKNYIDKNIIPLDITYFIQNNNFQVIEEIKSKFDEVWNGLEEYYDEMGYKNIFLNKIKFFNNFINSSRLVSKLIESDDFNNILFIQPYIEIDNDGTIFFEFINSKSERLTIRFLSNNQFYLYIFINNEGSYLIEEEPSKVFNKISNIVLNLSSNNDQT